MADQQRLQVSELHFRKLSTPWTLLEDNIQHPSKVLFRFLPRGNGMDQRSGAGRFGGRFNIISLNSRVHSFPEFWDAGREDCLCSEQDHPENSYLKQKVSLEQQKAQKEDRFLRARQTAYMIYDYFRITGAHDTVHEYADLFSPTLHADNIQELGTTKILSYDVFKSLYKLSTWVWTTQKQIGIVRDGDSSEDIDAKLSKIEDNGEEENRSETSIAKLWRQVWENRNRSSDSRNGLSGVERGKRYMLPAERKRPVFEGRPV